MIYSYLNGGGWENELQKRNKTLALRTFFKRI